jgi:hypothetical protein
MSGSCSHFTLRTNFRSRLYSGTRLRRAALHWSGTLLSTGFLKDPGIPPIKARRSRRGRNNGKTGSRNRHCRAFSTVPLILIPCEKRICTRRPGLELEGSPGRLDMAGAAPCHCRLPASQAASIYSLFMLAHERLLVMRYPSARNIPLCITIIGSASASASIKRAGATSMNRIRHAHFGAPSGD